MELPIADLGGGNSAKLAVPDELFAREFNAPLVHQAVVAAQAGARLATRKQKTRAEVSHTRRKLFRQKGSGRARAGHSSTPVRRGGGRAFPASPRDNFQHKLPRRMFRAAMASLLSQLAKEERLQVVRTLATESKKTADFARQIQAMNLSAGIVLMVDTEWDENILLACRNLPKVQVQLFSYILPSDLITADVVLFSERGIKKCAEVWA